jgi:NADH-quinone oxidoreductase subunit L
MPWIAKNLWLIPALPIVAAGISALLKQPRRKLSAGLAIGSMGLSFLLALCAFAAALKHPAGEEVLHQSFNFDWLQFGNASLQLGWVLDPLTAVMAVMVTFVGLLIFIYSVGYMAHDENFTRFFTFLSLFAGAMLGVVIANSLLLLFIAWELVGLTSYLLIGFWYHKPSASAAAKKAFITTRVGDIGFFIGMIWLYSASGTLLFYDGGKGCLEGPALTRMVAMTTSAGIAASTAIGLLIFCGAIGKSGQVPLHVWLPDAMEGPTPVSALIHAATMVAAGVFLVARVYPLMSAHPDGFTGVPPALQVVTWVGAITAVFAATIGVAQNDIKRILAYSTVSQLGFMMLGLGVGGVVVGIFHLITHAFFKALLFLGSGSVIHGCHEEQDIRYMGGLKKYMPVTFATYAAGMLALAGFPLFSGFWSKDDILHAAHGWHGYGSPWPFYLGLFGALLTAFYMTRQVCYVFYGAYRGHKHHDAHGHKPAHGKASPEPHESPAVMTWPLIILAFFAVVLGFVGTPAWPWFQSFVGGEKLEFDFGKLTEGGTISLMLLSAVVVFAGIGLGWRLYGRKPIKSAEETDALEKLRPDVFGLLRGKYFVDELYQATVIAFNARWAGVCDFFDRWVWGGAVMAVSYLFVGLSWLDRMFDEYVINLGFDKVCGGVRRDGGWLSLIQNGQVQRYLGIIGVALTALVLLLIWGIRAS